MLKARKTDAQARDLVGKIYRQTQLEPQMHQAAQRFITEPALDVMFGFENQILAIANDPANKERYRVETPYFSVAGRMPVAVVDKYADENGNRAAADAFVKFMFSQAGQELAAAHFHRPSDPEVIKKYTKQFPSLGTFTVNELFGEEDAVTQKFFAAGAIFDQQMQQK
jgi:sulfate transport system substrate-binding protein